MVYEKSLVVSTDDLDELKHVNNVRYVQWIQDISKDHWAAVAPAIYKENYIWVVLTHTIQYKQAACIHEEIIIKTHITKSSGVRCTRVVAFYRKRDNTLLVSASTVWCFLDGTTHKPIRIPDILNSLFLT